MKLDAMDTQDARLRGARILGRHCRRAAARVVRKQATALDAAVSLRRGLVEMDMPAREIKDMVLQFLEGWQDEERDEVARN